jgi:uncharacterized membrane protein YbhN (UPF0104 family)
MNIDYKKLGNILADIAYIYIPVLLVFIFLRNVIAAVRFRFLIYFKERIGLGILIKQYFIASFFNNFLPTALGGDGVRVFLLSECGISKSESVSFILVERLIGFFSYILIAFFTSFFITVPFRIIGLIYLVTALYTLVVVLIFYFGWKINADRIRFPLLKKMVTAFMLFKNHKKAIGIAFLFSFLFQFANIYITYLVSNALNMGIPLVFFLGFLPLIGLAVMIPVSLGGVGLREMAFVYFFSQVGVPQENALIISLGTYLTLIIGGLAGALLFFYDKIFLKVRHGLTGD